MVELVARVQVDDLLSEFDSLDKVGPVFDLISAFDSRKAVFDKFHEVLELSRSHKLVTVKHVELQEMKGPTVLLRVKA